MKNDPKGKPIKELESDNDWLERMKLSELPDPPRKYTTKPKWRMD